MKILQYIRNSLYNELHFHNGTLTRSHEFVHYNMQKFTVRGFFIANFHSTYISQIGTLIVIRDHMFISGSVPSVHVVHMYVHLCQINTLLT